MMNRDRNNFDILRLILSLIVVIVHTAELTKIRDIEVISSYFSSVFAVDAFFIVSGFLIFMSFDKSSSYINYLLKRVRRIAPAYATVIILSAIFLFFISSKGVDEYLSLEFIRYIIFNLLTLNFLQPTLAGVFEHNPIDAVNGALWTIKIEVIFYLLVPIISYISIKSSRLYTFLTIYILAISYSLIMIWLYNSTNSEIFLKLEKQIPSQLAFFISGASIYYLYDRFKAHSTILLFISIILLTIHHYFIEIYPLYPISLAIFIIYFATQFRYLGDVGKFGDLSFGIYIWHFPIIQTLIHLNLFSNLFVGITSLLLTLLTLSLLSWHYIERPFLYPSSHYISS